MMSEWRTYSLEDFLLFSPRTYWRLFELHNAEFWPLQIAVFILGVTMLALALRPGQWSGRTVFLILAVMWAWVGWSFLWHRYATINWAIIYVVPIFFVEAFLLIVGGKGRDPGPDRSFPRIAGFLLVLYALFLHPLIAPSSGRPVEAMEIFGMAPDPTAIATLGIILMHASSARVTWLLLPIPLVWCLLSGFTLLALNAWESWLPFGAAGIALTAQIRPRTIRHKV